MSISEATAQAIESFINNWFTPSIVAFTAGVCAVCIEILNNPLTLCAALVRVFASCFVGVMAAVAAQAYGLSANWQLVICSVASISAHNIIKLILEISANPYSAYQKWKNIRHNESTPVKSKK